MTCRKCEDANDDKGFAMFMKIGPHLIEIYGCKDALDITRQMMNKANNDR